MSKPTRTQQIVRALRRMANHPDIEPDDYSCLHEGANMLEDVERLFGALRAARAAESTVSSVLQRWWPVGASKAERALQHHGEGSDAG